MKTRTLGLIICAIGFLWMSTAIVATETASARYISQIMQESQAYAMPEGYANSTGLQNTIDRLIDISRKGAVINTTVASAPKEQSPVIMQAKANSGINENLIG